jgi:DNA-binding transcriptional regulator PaaX
MIRGKLKYYFRKPKSEIVKDVLKWLAIAGAVYIAASSPHFVLNLQKNFRKWRNYERKKISDVFSRLRREGCIKIQTKNHQIYISLTEKGKKKAGWLQIDSLRIKRPKKWDGKWRIVIFDISQLKKIYREAFRGKLKELGFYPLQKSVWVYPFDCRAEIELLREFFGLSEKEIRLIIATDIGEDKKLREFFKL